MKKLLMVFVLILNAVSMLAQNTIDFASYDKVGKTGDVTIIVKDNDYRMVVGTLKKPKHNMVMGYTKEQATSKIDRILDFSYESYTKKDRNVSVCGVMFLLNITGESDNENYYFVAVDKKVMFKLSVKDCNELKESILNYSAR